MDLLIEVLMTIAAIYACVIMCLLCIICYILKSPRGQQFELTDASLPDSPPDYKESTFLDLNNGSEN